MSSAIQWTDEVWNPVRGCSKVSSGCQSCYAMKQAHRFGNPGGPYEGLTKLVPGKGPQWTGAVRCVPEMLERPLRWRKPRRVFVNSMSDLFHPDVPFRFIAAVFGVMRHSPQHTYQILTKRPERAVEWFQWMGSMVGKDDEGNRVAADCDPVAGCDMQMVGHGVTPPSWDAGALPYAWPLPNVWMGTSVENQAAADERIPHLLRTPAAVRFLSCEPLLGPMDLMGLPTGCCSGFECNCRGLPLEPPPYIDWVIIGGESGLKARPMGLAWARSLVHQCHRSGTPAFVKQLGADPRVVMPTPCEAWPDSETEYSVRLKDRKGGDLSEWPEDLRVREFPQATEARP